MLLVLIFLGILVLLSVITLLLLFSSVQIQIQHFILQSEKEISNTAKLKISLYLLDKLKIASYTISVKKLKNWFWQKEKQKIEKIMKKNKARGYLKQFLKRIQIRLEKLDLKINIGTEDAILTSYATAAIGMTLGILYPHFVPVERQKNCTYFINPIYQDKNMYYISLDGILKIKRKPIHKG